MAFKKRLAILLAVCLVVMNTVPAFAANDIEPQTDTAEIETVLEDDVNAEIASPSEAEYEDAELKDDELIDDIVFDDADGEELIEEDSEELIEEDTEFFAEVKVGNVIITARAEAGVVPKGTVLWAKTVVDTEVKEAIDEVVEEKREDETQVVESLKFDIKLLKDGEEIEPDGLVSLSFALADAAANAEANIYHIIEDEETKELVEAEVLEVEKVEEPKEETPLVLETEVPSFSYYVVEFTVGELQYVLEGDSSVKLSEILAKLKIEGTVTEAVSGAPELFSVEKDATGDDWTVTALKAFSTEEWMKVTVDEQIYEITVTDDPEDTYTVHFDGNGLSGGSMANQIMTYGAAAKLNPNGFEPPSQRQFAGWAETPTATNPKYADGEVVINLAGTPGATVTLYAVWVEKSYTVVHYLIDKDSYGYGTITNNIDVWDPSDVDNPTGSTATAEEGYKFVGWKDASGNPVTDNTDVDVSDDGKTITPLKSSTKDTYYTAFFEKLLTIDEVLKLSAMAFPTKDKYGWLNNQSQGTRTYISNSNELKFTPGDGGSSFAYPLTTLVKSTGDGYQYENENVVIQFNIYNGVLKNIGISVCTYDDAFIGTYEPEEPTLAIYADKTEYEIGEVIKLTINVEGISGSTTVDITDGTSVWKLDTDSDGKAILSDATKTAAGTYTYTVTLPQFDGVCALIHITVKKPALQKTVGDILATVDDFPTTKETGWENENGEKAYAGTEKITIGAFSFDRNKKLTSSGTDYEYSGTMGDDTFTFKFKMLDGVLQSIELSGVEIERYISSNGTYKQASPKPIPDPKKKESSSGTYSVFTGTWNNPVSNGSWTLDANGVWHYTTNASFCNTWGYIVNPYATSGHNSADWFYFDAYGNMLTGWQLIGGKWYYLNPFQNGTGTLGACLIGPGKTPDGWTIDENGAWIGK